MADVITEDMIINEVVKKHPGAEEVFKKYFGAGCVTCPGSISEDIAFGAFMHNRDIKAIMKELNELVANKEG